MEPIRIAPAPTPATAHPLRNAYKYLRDESDVQVPDSYEEFEHKMLEKPERLRTLRDYFDEQDIYAGEDYDDFSTKMTAGLGKSGASSTQAPASAPVELPAAPAEAAPQSQLSAGDEPFVTPDAGQSTELPADVAQAIQQLPAAPELNTVIGNDGQVLDVRRKAGDGFEPVDVTDLKDRLPPTAPVYKVTNGDQTRWYYDRVLSKVAEGETEEQTESQASARAMGQELLRALHGMGSTVASGWRELRRIGLLRDRAIAGSLDTAPTAQEEADIQAPSPGQSLVDQSNEWAKAIPLSPYYDKQKFSVYNPRTYAVAAGRSAGLAAPMVLSALLPESKIAGVAQKMLAVGFDSQMLDQSPERAKAAGLLEGTPEYDHFVLADGAATLLVFKLGAAGLSAAGQQVVKSELVKNTLTELRTKGVDLTQAKLGEVVMAAARKAAPVIKRSVKEGAKMGKLGAALAVKDEATGRAANALLGERRFDEHTPGQLADDMASRGVELGIVGALSGAASAIGQARVRRPRASMAGAADAGAEPAVAPTESASPVQEAARRLEKGEVLTYRGKESKVRRVGRDAAGEIVRIELGNGRHVNTQSAEGETLIKALRARETGAAASELEAGTASAPAPESPPPSADTAERLDEAVAPQGGVLARIGGEVKTALGEGKKHVVPDGNGGFVEEPVDAEDLALALDGLQARAERGKLTWNLFRASYVGQHTAQNDLSEAKSLFEQDAKAFVSELRDAVTGPQEQPALPHQHEPVVEANGTPTAAAKSRVVAAPIMGEAPKKRQDILLDLRKLTGINLRFGKTGTSRKAGSFGSYDPASGSVRVSAAGNLDTTARAIGHALEGKYGLVQMPGSPAARAEQAELMGYGSQPPKGHADPEAFQAGEAWAEYVRARLLNPEAARSQYPEFTAHYDQQVPPKVQAQLAAFGRDVRVLEGATAHEAIMASVRMKPVSNESIMGVLKPQTTGPGFQLTFGDRLKATLLNSFHPFEKAMRYAREAGGGDPATFKPEENPSLLARLYLGIHDKMDNIVEHGLVDAKNQRRVDAKTGETMTLKWLYGALDTSTEGTIAAEQAQVISSMIARRTIEMVDKRVTEEVAAALDRGQTVDPAFLDAHPELKRRFGKQNAENLERQAGRHLGTLQAQRQAEEAVSEGIARQKQRWTAFSKQAEEALAGKRAALDKLRTVEEGMGRLEAAVLAEEFAVSGKRVAGRVRTIVREARQRVATLRGNAREQAAVHAARRVQEVVTERLKGLDRLEQARLKAVREKYAGSYPAAVRHAVIDTHQKDVVTGIGAGLVSDVELARQRLAVHEALATSNPAQHARIEEAARRYQAYADANLQYLVEKGRLSKAQYEAIKATNSQYVALQRVMEAEPGAEIQVFAGQSLRQFTRAATPVKVQQGSGRIIKDPYGSLLEATYRTVKEADRNTILLAMRDLLRGEGKPGASGSSLADVGTRALPGDPHTVSVLVDGQREAWQLAPELYQAINELGNAPLDGPLASMLQSPAKLLRWTVTHSPVFAARNFIRDQRSRAVVSTSGLGAGLGAGVRLLADRAAYRTATDGLELHGGGQAGHYLANEQNYYDTMQRTVAELAQNKRFILADPAKLAKGLWRRYTTLLGGSETLTRKQEYRAAYEKAKAQGMDDYNASLFAAHEARDLMDFAVAGTAIRELNKYVPFTNAAVQGLRKAAASAQADPGGFALRWTIISLVPTIALRTLIHKLGRDDEYAQLPAYQRDGFDNIPLPNGQWLVIPRPFELGTMAASADRFLSKNGYGDEHAWEGYGGSMTKSFVPVDDAAVAGPLKPILEVMTNHDFYRDKAIVPQNEERLALELRHTERASKLGQWVGAAVGLDSRKVDHLVKGMGSYYGDWLLKASNLGRGDGMGQSFGMPDSGFIRGSAGAHARDVDFLRKRLIEAGMGQSELAKEIKEATDAYYEALSPADREQAARALRELAVRLRAELDDQFFQDQAQRRKEKVDAFN